MTVLRVLTGQGGDFEVPAHVREMVAYLDNGQLFISKTHSFNPHVRALKEKLVRAGHNPALVLVDMKKIAEFYNAASVHHQFAGDSSRESRSQIEAREIFARAVRVRASDIHIRVTQKDKTQILFRVMNNLEFIEEHSFDYGMSLCSTIYQAMADVADAVFEPLARQDARIASKEKLTAGLDGIRIATTPQVGGVLMVLRLLYNDTADSDDLELLGYGRYQADCVKFMRRKTTGINLIAGPTGSGKSTTLQRILSSIHRTTNGKKNIITVEDPPEYPIIGAVQTPVTNAETEADRSAAFQQAIRSALRLDPDIIMIGEIRDGAAAQLAIRAAMTGHQVWTTIHANNAFAIIDRLVDLGVPREILADPSIVSGLVCQRLVQRLCDECKVPFLERYRELPEDDRDRVMGSIVAQKAFVTGPGCSCCNHTGVFGRLAVAETIVTDHTMMELVQKNDKKGMIDYWRSGQQGRTMVDLALDLVNSGKVDPFAAEDAIGPLSSSRIEEDHRINRREVLSSLGFDVGREGDHPRGVE